MRRNEKGFTLIELMLVVAIVAVMSIMAFPTFSGWIARARLRDAARTVYSDLQLARIKAIETGGEWRINFNPDDNSYTVISSGPDMDLDNSADDNVVEKVVRIPEKSKGVVFGTDQGPVPGLSEPDDGISFGGNSVDFNYMGSVDGLGGSIYLKNERSETFAIVVSSANARIRMARNYGGTWEE